MDYTPDEQITAIRKLCPDLDEDQLREVKEALDGYCALLCRIVTRLENERKESLV